MEKTMVTIQRLKKDAKLLKKLCRRGDETAITQLQVYFPHADPEKVGHSTCLCVVARNQGYQSWEELMRATCLQEQ